MVAARSSLRACLVAGLPLLLQAFLLPHANVRPAVPTTRSKVASYGASFDPRSSIAPGPALRAAKLLDGRPLHQPSVPSDIPTYIHTNIHTPTAHSLDGQEIPGPLEPLGNYMLVKVKDAADVSAGGIVLPDQVRDLRGV
jgi:hypothetical protein